MTTDELNHLLHEVDRLYAYQPFGVTKSIIEKVKDALQELIELKKQNGDART